MIKYILGRPHPMPVTLQQLHRQRDRAMKVQPWTKRL